MDKVTGHAVSTNHNLFEEKGEPKRYRTEVLPLTNLTPYRWAKPALVPAGPGPQHPRRLGGWETTPNGCHHQNDSCMKMGSDESHYNVLMKREPILNVVQSPGLRVYGNSGIQPDGQQ